RYDIPSQLCVPAPTRWPFFFRCCAPQTPCTLATPQREGSSSPLPSPDQMRTRPQTPPLGAASVRVRRSERLAAAVREAAVTAASPAAAPSPVSGSGCGSAAATRAAAAAATPAVTTTAAARASGRCRVRASEVMAAAEVALVPSSTPPLEVISVVRGKRSRATAESDCGEGVCEPAVGTAAEQRASQRQRTVVEGIL
ncbi:hypothetical protein Vretifemale_1999, partial [Volvox reticuliferus]